MFLNQFIFGTFIQVLAMLKRHTELRFEQNEYRKADYLNVERMHSFKNQSKYIL